MKAPLYTLSFTLLVLSASIFWHAETEKYHIAVTGQNYFNYATGETVFNAQFIKFNTRTGAAIESCNIEGGNCYDWEEYRQKREAYYKQNSESSLRELIEKKETKAD